MDDRISQREDVGSKTVETARSGEEDRIVEDSRRHQEAQAAFQANSELDAVTPRQSVWTGRNLLARDEAGELPASPSTRSTETDWRPSLAIGSINADRLGPKEAARRHMLQWDHIWDYNRVHNPHSLHVVEEHMAEARKEYEEICARENAQDIVPKHELQAFQEERIEARVALLRQTLVEADAEGTEPMRRNITAALDGYTTGALGFSHTYALIYAGQIVDTTCTSYAEFTVDRQSRLDRYFAQHGPGYLWWEPPLARSRDRVSAKKGIVLELDREDDYLYHQHAAGSKFRDDSCHFQISLGFQNDNSLRHRKQPRLRHGEVVGPKRKWEFVRDFDSAGQPVTKKRAGPTSINKSQTPGESAEGKRLKILTPFQRTRNLPPTRRLTDPVAGIAEKEEEDAGPTMFFDMLLDSGAEIPILLHDDFRLLGYTKEDMNAATVVELNAAAGQNSTALCFELLVGLDLHGPEDENEEEAPLPPRRHFFPTRVVKLGPAIKPPPHGGYSGDRLSGILPFLAYYTSSAPGRDELCIGDERADVLGMQKMPAGLRYDPFRKTEMALPQHAREVFKQTGGPPTRLRRVTFEHEVRGGRRLIDRESVSRGSPRETRTKLTLVGADRKVAASWEMDSAQQGKGQWKRVEY